MIKITELLNIYKQKEVDDFIKKYTYLDLNENNLNERKIIKSWKFLDNNESNASNINLLKNGEKGLVERITNAIDAVIEKEKITNKISSAKSQNSIIKKAFPKYYNFIKKIKIDKSGRLSAKDANDKVLLIVNDGSKSNKPTFDIIDRGTGIEGNDFESTILSLNKGNKLSSDKSYLIGAFGQGGSTSLPFTYATIILSKRNNKFFFTIIKKVKLEDYKNYVYVYMTIDNKIPEIVNNYDYTNCENYITDFLNSDSGTFIRMIETDISKSYRDNEVTKPGMLIDYINTELFNVGLPIKIIDRRKDYLENSSSQNRYSHGTYLKLQTSEHVNNKYCGKMEIEHKNNPYEIDYYIILPKDESLWGNESECQKVFKQFNTYCDPIIYTVNGQTITTKDYRKIKNSGLTFLKYRLLVVINLDNLGTEKYSFFTSNRAELSDTDLTKGFIDKVIEKLVNVDKLQEINNIIAEKSIISAIDKDLLEDISKDVKNKYNNFLKTTGIFKGKKGKSYGSKNEEEIFNDTIDTFEITTEKIEFYKNQNINIVITTSAQKYVNENAKIYAYIDGKSSSDYHANYMNGRIQYVFNPKKLEIGKHDIFFTYYKTDIETMHTQTKEIIILNKNMPENENDQLVKDLDLNIIFVEDANLICDISKNTSDKNISIKLCLDTKELRNDVYGISSSTDDISKIKQQIIKPIVLFTLFYGEEYDEKSDNEKNKIVLSHIQSFLSCQNNL